MIQRILCCLFWLLWTGSAVGQTVLFEENFESGTPGGFTVVNGTQPIGWYVGTPAGNGPRLSGSKTVFISTNGTSYGPIAGANGIVHLYRDVAFPANETVFNLRLDVQSAGILQIFLVPTSYQPVAGTAPPYSTLANSGTLRDYGLAYGTTTIRLPASVAGTTQRLVFTWTSYASNNVLPAALDNIRLLAGLPPRLSGTYTVSQQLPWAGRNYQSLLDAVWELNTAGTAGPVTLEVATDQRFEGPLQLQGNTYPITIRRSGAGANPQVRAQGYNTAILLAGADRVTFDGIDVVPGTNGPSVGYSLQNLYGYGNHYITIRNATITMKHSDTGTKAIYQRSQLIGSPNPTDTLAVNGHITYENLTIRKANSGIWVESAGTGQPEYDVRVTHVTVGDTVAQDIGYPTGSLNARGMFFSRVNGLRVHDNLVQNVVSRTQGAEGITAFELTGPRPSAFTNNRIHNIEFVLPSVGSFVGASITGLNIQQISTYNATAKMAAAADVTIANNEIQGLNLRALAGTAAPSGSVSGLFVVTSAFPTGTTRIAHNTLVVASPEWGNSTVLSISHTATDHGLLHITNNLLQNTTPTATFPARNAVLAMNLATGETPAAIQRLQCDYNNMVPSPVAQSLTAQLYAWPTGTPQGFSYATLADWQAGTQLDANSRKLDPLFAPGLALRPTNPALDNAGHALSYVTTDLAGRARSTPPDVGAYEFGPVTSTAASRSAGRPSVWPVPFIDDLFVQLPGTPSNITHWKLLDAFGRPLRQQAERLAASGALHITGLAALPPGVYLLQLHSATVPVLAVQLLHQ